jgi:hypothetical protein
MCIFPDDLSKRKHCLYRRSDDFSNENLRDIENYQNKWVILGQELTENNLRKRRIRSQRLHFHRPGAVSRVPHWLISKIFPQTSESPGNTHGVGSKLEIKCSNPGITAA